VAWNEAERWEVWAIPHFKVYVLTEHEMGTDEDHPWRESLPGVQSQIDPLATAAASNFLRAVRWRTGQYWLPKHLTLSKARASVEFYQAGERVPYGRFELEARAPATETALSHSSRETVEEDLRNNRQATLPEVLLLDAMLYRSVRDYRVALMLGAISLETALITLLRRRLAERRVATASQIDKFLEETSNRLLSTVGLSLVGVGDDAFRDGSRKVFELRNDVIHGKRKSSPTQQEATSAIHAAKTMLAFLLENAPSTSRTVGQS
jgi:hypothetical protein